MQKKKCHAICVCKVRLIIHIKCNQLLKKIKQKLLNEKKNNMIIESLLGFRIKSVVFKNWLSYHIEVDFGVHKEYLYNHNTTSRTNARVHSLTISLWLGQRVKGICQSTLRLWKQKDGVLLQVTKGSDVLSFISLLSVILSFSFILSKDDVILDANH